MDIIKNVLLPKERQVETNKFIITYKSCCKLLLLDTQIRPLCLRSSKIVFNYISSYQAVQQSDFSKNFPLNGIHPNFFASFFCLITVRLGYMQLFCNLRNSQSFIKQACNCLCHCSLLVIHLFYVFFFRHFFLWHMEIFVALKTKDIIQCFIFDLISGIRLSFFYIP